MVIDTTQKQRKNVRQISVFVLPEEKVLVEQKAEADGRSVSNYCKRKILEAQSQD